MSVYYRNPIVYYADGGRHLQVGLPRGGICPRPPSFAPTRYHAMKATAHFDVTGWNPASTDEPDEGPAMSRVDIRKAFTGGYIEGESKGEGLFCGMDDPEAGAGYVVSERFTGRLATRQGSFVIQHGGVMGPETASRSFGHVVPGSGTGELTGLAGEVQISQNVDGQHTLSIDYHFHDEGGA